jgi:hypothetical protein
MWTTFEVHLQIATKFDRFGPFHVVDYLMLLWNFYQNKLHTWNILFSALSEGKRLCISIRVACFPYSIDRRFSRMVMMQLTATPNMVNTSHPVSLSTNHSSFFYFLGTGWVGERENLNALIGAVCWFWHKEGNSQVTLFLWHRSCKECKGLQILVLTFQRIQWPQFPKTNKW